MPIRKCPQCDDNYDQDAPWKRVCITCFKINKRKEEAAEREFRRMVMEQQDTWEGTQSVPGKDQELLALRKECDLLRERMRGYERRIIWYEEQHTDLKVELRQTEHALERERQKRHEPPPLTLRDLSVSIKDLIKLTHPDRHNGDALANRVTGELITAMKRARA